MKPNCNLNLRFQDDLLRPTLQVYAPRANMLVRAGGVNVFRG